MNVNVHTNLGLIGDALAGLPFLYDLSKTNEVTISDNLNSWVLEGIDFPLTVNSNLDIEDCTYALNASLSWHYCATYTNLNLHMMQGHYGVNDFPIPPIPMTVPLKQTECNLEPGIVIAPYSRTDWQGNKFWSFENWLKLVSFFPDPIYLLGSKDDSIDWIAGTKIIPVLGNSMPFVSSLLKKGKLVVTIDTGIAHLAHLLEIKTHAYLWATICPWHFTSNPNSSSVYDFPGNVTVERMLECCKIIPNWQN